MPDRDPLDFSDLESDVTPDGKFAPPAKKTKTPKAWHKCLSCGGSGLWQGGRINKYGNAKCHDCAGRGGFTTSPEYRAKAQKMRAAKKAKDRADSIADFERQAPGLRDFLRQAAEWSEFAASLSERVEAGKGLSERQISAALSMAAKCAQRKAEREAAKKADTVTVDLSPIREIFEAAADSGYKKPTYRAEGLVISRAPMHGANPGALYVKNLEKTYGGKVVGTTYKPAHAGTAADFAPYEYEEGGERVTVSRSAAEALAVIAADPLAAAVRYGQRTGICSCCGAKLTNALSIELGIGPICRSKWGMGGGL